MPRLPHSGHISANLNSACLVQTSRCFHRSAVRLDKQQTVVSDTPERLRRIGPPPKRRLRMSKMYLPTMKDTPTFAAESESHTLMLRAGLIRQSSAGIHSFLPFGLRSLQKLERIIDEEMENIGAHKLVLPNVLTSEAWMKTGRWESSGQELYRLKDRKGTAFLLAPTHEEEITQLVASDVVSTRQLPVRLYQIGKKFRDEARPRAGLLRGREFVMKDLYTFDACEADALQTYEAANEAYRRIFGRIGLPFAVAEADTGNIGGTRSHEYHFVSQAGEDKLLTCQSCSYTANEERACSRPHLKSTTGGQVSDANAILELSQNINLPQGASPAGMSLVFEGSELQAHLIQEDKINVVVINKAGRRTNDVKASKLIGRAVENAVDGTSLILDAATAETMPAVKNVLSAGKSSEIIVEDIMVAEPGDPCPSCNNGSLAQLQAIEVGHAFHLGHRYSQPLAAVYKTQEGDKQVMVPFSMGCFGIGLSRILGAVVQMSRDADGIIWPESLAPYKVCIIPTFNIKRREQEEAPVMEAVERIYDSLQQEQQPGRSFADDVLIDDRWDLTFGQRIREAMLVGYPYVVVVGKGYVENGNVDLIVRAGNKKQTVPLTRVVDELAKDI